MKQLLLVISAIISFSMNSCDTSGTSATPDLTGEKKYDLSYGPDTRNKMDVYLPAHRSSQTPFVLLIHGGGWNSGDKSDFNAFQDSLMARGMASASISYRYAGSTVHYGAMMADVDAALNYCMAQAASWQTRSSDFVMSGYSAGGHMALLYSYNYDNRQKVKTVISLAGPTDMTDYSWLNYAVLVNLIGAIENMTGAVYTLNQPLPAAFAEASPIRHIRNMPTLMIHGTADVVVYYSQSQALQAQLNAMGITNKLVSINNAGHDLGLAIPANFQLVMNEYINWVNTHGK